MAQHSSLVTPSFAEAFRFWLKLGCISFGGPSGQIAIMHEELVERRRWIDEERFLHALNFCLLLPGPEATQLATYIGWLLHRTWGGIVAGVFFVLPSALLLWGLSLIYVQWGKVPAVAAALYGLKPAVLAIIGAALLRIGGRTLKGPALYVVAILSFVAIHLMHLPFPVVIGTAAILGIIKHRLSIKQSTSATPPLPPANPSKAGLAKTLLTCLLLWFGPQATLMFWLGRDHVLVQQGIFFSKAAMVTFGGAYAVLPYVSQQAVETHHWLSAGQMLDGLGLAETTPGPLIMVLQFIGFIGAWNHPAPFSPMVAATLGAFITTWTTFVPCFLWIFLGAPYMERLRSNPLLQSGLTFVSAAVVGVILALAVGFGTQVLYPNHSHVDWWAVSLTIVSLLGLTRWRWNVMAVIGGSAAAGMVWKLWLT